MKLKHIVSAYWLNYGSYNCMNTFPLICEHLQRNPSLLLQAKETLLKWEKNQVVPHNRIEQWRVILDDAIRDRDGLQKLIELLLDEGDQAKRVKDFAPFAGLLPREERRKAFLLCVYDH
jgi:hypothetical protein